MKARGFLVLLAATIAAIAGAGITIRLESSAESPSTGDRRPLFPGLAQEIADLSRLRVKTPAYALVMERRGATWVAADRGDYPLRQASVANVLTGLGELRLVESKTANPDLYARIGVEDPNAKGAGSNLVSLDRGSASLGDLIIGKHAESIGYDPLGGTFVRRPAEAQSWLAQGSPTIPPALSGWFDELPSYPSVDVARVQVSDGGKIVFDAVKDGDSYKPAAAASDASPVTTQVNDAAVKRLAQVVGTGTFEDVAAADKVNFSGAARSMHFELANGVSIDISLGEKDGQKWVRYIPTATVDSSAAAQVNDFAARAKSYAFALPDYQLSALTIGVDQLIAAAGEANMPDLPAPSAVIKQTR